MWSAGAHTVFRMHDPPERRSRAAPCSLKRAPASTQVPRSSTSTGSADALSAASIGDQTAMRGAAFERDLGRVLLAFQDALEVALATTSSPSFAVDRGFDRRPPLIVPAA